ncbi:TadE/TadG family type IV pilus assembly protein [Pectobacterium sp. B2J-2]|uniref:TadE/TadG family type IV pilus assembly protein n=1 Tax=Pectobacterium sp. B2J-2 TaxID=3385372 RepID=UPI0038FBFD9D
MTDFLLKTSRLLKTGYVLKPRHFLHGLYRFWFSRRASTAVETALAFPIVLAIGSLCADIYTVGLERTRMEQRAGAIASILAMQQKLDEQGLQGLLDAVLPTEGAGNYQLLISNVRQTGELYWQLSRGTAEALCAESETLPGGEYLPELPERDREEGSKNTSMMVVEICRQGKDVSLLGGLSLGGLLHASSVNRVAINVVELDEVLRKEAGLEEEEQ